MVTKVFFHQLNTLCLSNDLLKESDVNDLRLVKKQTFNAAWKGDGLVKDLNTPAGLNMLNICAENIVFQ